MIFEKLTKKELIDLIIEYDTYIYNDGEEWDRDRQPISIAEFHNNKLWEKLNRG